MFKLILCLSFTSCSLFSLEQYDILEIIRDKKLCVELADVRLEQKCEKYYLMGFWDALDVMENEIKEMK